MAKTATFGVMHLITAFSITYAMTGSVAIAGAVTFVEPLANTFVHYYLDKYWDHPRVQSVRAGLSKVMQMARKNASTSAPNMQQSPEAMQTIRA